MTDGSSSSMVIVMLDGFVGHLSNSGHSLTLHSLTYVTFHLYFHKCELKFIGALIVFFELRFSPCPGILKFYELVFFAWMNLAFCRNDFMYPVGLVFHEHRSKDLHHMLFDKCIYHCFLYVWCNREEEIVITEHPSSRRFSRLAHLEVFANGFVNRLFNHNFLYLGGGDMFTRLCLWYGPLFAHCSL